MLGGTAFAQDPGDSSYYFVTYYSNANTSGAPDGTLRIVYDGDLATTETEGKPNSDIFADIYVFDDSEEFQDCCSCFISPDGLLSESVNKELVNDTVSVTGRAEINRGVIKVVGDRYGEPEDFSVAPGLRGFMTHVQATSTTVSTTPPFSSTGKAPFYVTETPLADSNLSTAETDALEETCSLAITLGSGAGICTCTFEDHDF